MSATRSPADLRLEEARKILTSFPAKDYIAPLWARNQKEHAQKREREVERNRQTETERARTTATERERERQSEGERGGRERKQKVEGCMYDTLDMLQSVALGHTGWRLCLL